MMNNKNNVSSNVAEEEEILVYVQFEDDINIGNFRDIHVLGITENKPIIQMDDSFFTGKFMNSMGTYMFFENDLNPKSEDPLFDKLPERNLKYVNKTTKLLEMEHVYVTPKGKDQQRNTANPPDKIETVPFKTVEEALQIFKAELSQNSETRS